MSKVFTRPLFGRFPAITDSTVGSERCWLCRRAVFSLPPPERSQADESLLADVRRCSGAHSIAKIYMPSCMLSRSRGAQARRRT